MKPLTYVLILAFIVVSIPILYKGQIVGQAINERFLANQGPKACGVWQCHTVGCCAVDDYGSCVAFRHVCSDGCTTKTGCGEFPVLP